MSLSPYLSHSPFALFFSFSLSYPLFLSYTNKHTHTHTQSFLQQCSLKPCSTHPQQAATSSDQVTSLSFPHSFILLYHLPLSTFLISFFYYLLLHDLMPYHITPMSLRTVRQHSIVSITDSYLSHISSSSFFQLKFPDFFTVNGGFSFTVELSRTSDSLSCIAALSTSVVMVSQSVSQPPNPSCNTALLSAHSHGHTPEYAPYCTQILPPPLPPVPPFPLSLLPSFSLLCTSPSSFTLILTTL